MEDEAFKLLKQKGVVIGFVDKLFGKDYVEFLQQLIEVLSNAGAVIANSPEKFESFMLNFGKLVDGKTNNLRGDLFELAVGYYYSVSKSDNISINKIINFEDKKK